MAISVLDYAEGIALPPKKRLIAADVIRELATDLAKDRFEAIVTFDLDFLADIFSRWVDPETKKSARLPNTANPRLWPRASVPEETLIVLLRYDDQFVGASAQRLIWLEGTLRRALETGWFFFGDTSRVPPGWRCVADISETDMIAECPVIYNCAYRMELDGVAGGKSPLWKQRVSWRMARISQALALAHWRWSWMMARSDEALTMRFAPQAGGFTTQVRGLFVYQPGKHEPEKWQHLQFARRRDLSRLVIESPAYRTGDSLISPLPSAPPLSAFDQEVPS